VLIRDATDEDWARIWPFFHAIVAAGETFTYDRGMTEAQGRAIWMLQPPGRTVVAVDPGDTVLGTANMYANRTGPGAHVSSASFMVDSAQACKGVGRALGEDALRWARGQGFHAMQFNAVVESNTRAVRLWQSIGFEIVGTVPEAFEHPTEGLVGLHVMYQRL
jgi:L-amino acid N-acyltransferase YncA